MKIAPSVLTADFAHLSKELSTIDSADYIHVDIMDGHFVPNISFGPAITLQIAKETNVPLDIHLMVTDPINWIDDFAKSKPEFITIHIEANKVDETIQRIRSHGIKVGLSLKPNTSVDVLNPYLDKIDLVLVMSVEPGFGGQKFIPSAAEKINYFSKLKSKKNNYLIEVDGGINDQTASIVKASGVDIAVVGSYLFNQTDRKETIKKLK